MGGFVRAEPMLSKTCCAGSDLYHPIGRFRIDDRI